MSNSEPEKMLMHLLEFFHQNAGEAYTLNKSKLEEVLKKNFPTFVSACVSGSLEKQGLGVGGTCFLEFSSVKHSLLI